MKQPKNDLKRIINSLTRPKPKMLGQITVRCVRTNRTTNLEQIQTKAIAHNRIASTVNTQKKKS